MSDSDSDDLPLAAPKKRVSAVPAGSDSDSDSKPLTALASAPKPARESPPKPAQPAQDMKDEDSDSDEPLTALADKAKQAKAGADKKRKANDGDAPAPKRPKREARVKTENKAKSESESDEDMEPCKARQKAKAKPKANGKKAKDNGKAKKDEGAKEAKPKAKAKAKKDEGAKQAKPKAKKEEGAKEEAKEEDEEEEEGGWWEMDLDLPEGHKWKTLHHNGVLFPPEYSPHGVKMLYDGKPVDLTPEQEEVASWYAGMLESDYTQKERFNNNFFEDFLRVLNKGSKAKHVIKKLDKCDFRPIHLYLKEQSELRKNRSKEEKQKDKEEKDRIKKKYGVAMVDGRPETIGNFNIEPPGLFRGRGDHPKMGRIKARVQPEEVTLNISKDAPVPPCPVPGHKWGKIVHRPEVTWLAFWKDSIKGDFKYVFLAASSRFRGESDRNKYEKARELKKHIDLIRKDYTEAMRNDDDATAQLGTAMWVIDRLALRVGNEKDTDEEADTVGCCSLRVEHAKLLDDNKLELDFLGKDSIRYYNVVTLPKQVHKNFARFMKKKKPADMIFDKLNPMKLNKHLGSLMKGLSAKVFRTYNASVTLEQCLEKEREAVQGTDLLAEKLIVYNRANCEVAILCNHQRAAPKNFDQQMERFGERIASAEQDLQDAKDEAQALKKLIKGGKTKTIKYMARVSREVGSEDGDDSSDDEDDKKTNAKKKKKAAKEKDTKKDAKKGKKEDKEEEEKKKKVQVREEVEKEYTVEQAEKRLEAVNKRIERNNARVVNLKSQRITKEDQKTVALSTSKINYIDPRITVAWCKAHDVPLNKVFNKALLDKFPWAFKDKSIDDAWKF